MKMKCNKACELCNQHASFYCPSDSAFLCRNCDHAVHGVNFLVARHRRHILCSKCESFTGIHITGTELRRFPSTCRSCSPENHSDDTDSQCSSSESCVTAPKKTKARRMKTCKTLSSVIDDASPIGSVAEELFEKWSRELGLGFKVTVEGLRRWKLVPLKVGAAASFWLGLRLCRDGCLATFQNLIRLEKISGVPAKLILAANVKLTRVCMQLQVEREEGSDEC
ncbi:B-box zinc finger protein 32-like [Vicia villosa]|uniref:B-box zinc finger protein 32-like n=1 Tax=Vicia villosa TaxID=3911 RepID=UPI00273B2B09|nr:B-box zinc finger protein 32-like [Vicia villosa]